VIDIKEKDIINEFDKVIKKWEKNKENISIDADILDMFFRSEGGLIYINTERKGAIGLLPFPKMLGVYLFDLDNNGKLKCIGNRGIILDGEIDVSVIKNAIDICGIKGTEHDNKLVDDISVS